MSEKSAKAQIYSIYIFHAISYAGDGIIGIYQRKDMICVTDERDAWNTFLNSGSVLDYLRYKSIQRDSSGGMPEEDKDEVQDKGTDTQTAEYR